MLRLNGHLNLKSEATAWTARTLIWRQIAGKRPSWELNFQIFERSISPDPGSGSGGPCPPLWIFFVFTETKFTSKKISVKLERNLSQNAGNGNFRDSNFQIFLGKRAPRPP